MVEVQSVGSPAVTQSDALGTISLSDRHWWPCDSSHGLSSSVINGLNLEADNGDNQCQWQ